MYGSVANLSRPVFTFIVAISLYLMAGLWACAAPSPPAAAPSGSSSATAPALGQATAPPGPAERLRAGYGAVSGANAAAWFMVEKGIDRKHGLEVELTYVATGGVPLVQSLIAGELDIALTNVNTVITGNLEGADVVMVGTPTPYLIHALYAQPEIRTIQDLKGKTVGVSRFGSATDFAARLMLQKAGLKPDEDVTMFQTGSVPNTLAAIESRQIAAGDLSPPNTLKAKALGLREVANSFDVEFPSTGIIITRAFLRDRASTLEKYLKAFVESIALAKRDKASALEVLAKYTQTDEREIVEEVYELYLVKLQPRLPLVPAAGVQLALDEAASSNPRARDARPQDFFDNSLLERLERSGFVDALYK